jgi:hypothetical protein
LRKNITLSGRRWKTHGSSKESGGKEASKEAGKESSKEEIIFAKALSLFSENLFWFNLFFQARVDRKI